MNNEARPVLLSTQEQFATYWPQVEPLLASAPVVEEYGTDELLNALLARQMFIFIFVRDTEDLGEVVEFVTLFSTSPSEKLRTATIITVAGKNLKQYVSQFWEYFKGWCIMNGVRAIDAYVPERLEGFVEKLGLKKEAVHVRLRLQS